MEQPCSAECLGSNSFASSSSTCHSNSSSSNALQTRRRRQHHHQPGDHQCAFAVSAIGVDQLLPVSSTNSSWQQQATPEQLLAGMQLHVPKQHLQQPGHLPLAAITLPLLQQVADQLQGWQQHIKQHEQQQVQPDHATIHQQQQVQPDRAAPLFVLSEYTQQKSGNNKQREQVQPDRNKLRTRGFHENPATMPGTLCVEADAGGRQRVYRIRSGVDKGSGKMWEGFDMVRSTVGRTPPPRSKLLCLHTVLR